MPATRCTLVCPFCVLQNQVAGGEERPTYAPPHHAPKPRTYSACTAVMPTRFSVSAKCAFNCANCACRWVYCLLRLTVEAEVDVEEGWAREVEGRWEDGADILESHRVSKVRIVMMTLAYSIECCCCLAPRWTASGGHVGVHQFVQS